MKILLQVAMDMPWQDQLKSAVLVHQPTPPARFLFYPTGRPRPARALSPECSPPWPSWRHLWPGGEAEIKHFLRKIDHFRSKIWAWGGRRPGEIHHAVRHHACQHDGPNRHHSNHSLWLQRLPLMGQSSTTSHYWLPFARMTGLRKI